MSNFSIQKSIDGGMPQMIAAACQKAKLGTMLSKVKVTVTGLTAASSVDITTAAVKAAAAISGLTLSNEQRLPAIGSVQSLRVTAGAAAAGARTITDAGGTPAAGVARLSDDGKTLTFEGNVTGFVLIYNPASAFAFDADSGFIAP